MEDILWVDKGMLKGEVSRLNVEDLIFVLYRSNFLIYEHNIQCLKYILEYNIIYFNNPS